MCSTEDVAANLETAAALVHEASRAGAELIGLPENFAYLGSDKDHKTSLAEALEHGLGDGRRRVHPAAHAAAGGRHRCAGCCWAGFPSGCPAPRAGWPTPACCWTRAGKSGRGTARCTCSTSRSRAGHQFRESDTVLRGDDPVMAETPWGPIGLTICYDLRFPELYRELTRRGARILAVPAAFTRETGKDHWHVLLRGAGHREPGLRTGPRPVGLSRRQARQLRTRRLHRPLGRGPRRMRRTRRLRPGHLRLRLPGQSARQPPLPLAPAAVEIGQGPLRSGGD